MATGSNPENFTSDYIAYFIALNGRFFLRTEKMMGYDVPSDLEEKLVAKFPKSEGFTIEREVHPNGHRNFTVTN